MHIYCTRSKKIPNDEIASRVLVVFLEQFKASEWPRAAMAGAWAVLCPVLNQRPSLATVALELDIFGVAIAQLRAIGSDGSWVVSLLCVCCWK